MGKGFICCGALLIALATAVSAYAAHGLPETVTAIDSLAVDNALQFMLVNAIGLILAGTFQQRSAKTFYWVATACLMLAGILLFSINLLAVKLAGVTLLQPLVPVGGSLMILSWIGFALSVYLAGEKQQ